MKIKIKNVHQLGLGLWLGCLYVIAVFLGLSAISWIITCGLVKLITLCFGWTFSWSVATGVWLVWWILNSIFSRAGKKG